MLEMKLQQNKMTLKTKLPDIEKALEMVKYLASKKVCPPLRTCATPFTPRRPPLTHHCVAARHRRTRRCRPTSRSTRACSPAPPSPMSTPPASGSAYAFLPRSRCVVRACACAVVRVPAHVYLRACGAEFGDDEVFGEAAQPRPIRSRCAIAAPPSAMRAH